MRGMFGLADVRVHLLLLVALAVGWIVAGPGPAPETKSTANTIELVPPIPRLANHDERTCPGCIQRNLRDL